jgi:hypothetical protein
MLQYCLPMRGRPSYKAKFLLQNGWSYKMMNTVVSFGNHKTLRLIALCFKEMELAYFIFHLIYDFIILCFIIQ